MFLDELPNIEDVQFSIGSKSVKQKAKNYVIYCRKSDERDDRTSLPAQLSRCMELAASEQLNVIGVVYEQKSARAYGRIKFSNLIAAIKGEEELQYLDELP